MSGGGGLTCNLRKDMSALSAETVVQRRVPKRLHGRIHGYKMDEEYGDVLLWRTFQSALQKSSGRNFRPCVPPDRGAGIWRAGPCLTGIRITRRGSPARGARRARGPDEVGDLAWGLAGLRLSPSRPEASGRADEGGVVAMEIETDL